MFKILINFLTGYSNIEVEGYYIEKFINICINNGIFLWKIDRKKTTQLNARIGTHDIEKAREIAKRAQCFIIEKRKKGLPFLWSRYKKRKSFFISFAIMMIIIFALSRFVWNIEITGIKKIDKNEILDLATENGIRVGKLKRNVNPEVFINKVRAQREDIAWVGAEIKGTNVIIKIVEAEEKPEIVDDSDFSNIVAKKDGTISKIYAQNGTAQVKVGDEVKKGDILIGGWMDGDFTERRFVNGNGVVKAIAKYSDSIKINKKETKRDKTGKKESKISIKINNFQINFFKRLSKFEKYDTIYTEKKLQLFPNFYLPISFVKRTNFEVNETEINNDYSTAKQEAEDELKTKLNELIEGEIVNISTDVDELESYYKVTVTYDVQEEIGIKEKIEF